MCLIIIHKYFLQSDWEIVYKHWVYYLELEYIGIINMKLFEGKTWRCSTLQTTPIANKFDHILNFSVRNHFCSHDEFIPFFFIGQHSSWKFNFTSRASKNRISWEIKCILHSIEQTKIKNSFCNSKIHL